MDASRGSILVTGGAGYIGSHVAKALVRAGHQVVVYDNLSAGHREAVRWCDLVVGDIHDVEQVRETLRRYRVHAVMHFAAWLSVGESVRDPQGYYWNNVEGSLALIRAMLAERARLLVFSSTAAVYGNPDEVPMTEGHATRPINPYGDTKLAVERALVHFDHAHGLRSVVLRYFNASGADPDGDLGEDHQPEIHLVPRAIEAVLGGEPLQVFGDDYETTDGTCLRDYVHVSDLADAHLLALGRLEAGGASAAYNLGNGTPFSVRDVIQSVERVAGRAVPWTGAPRRAGDPGVLFASSARIRAELGWEPRFTELDGIVDTAWRWRLAHPNGFAREAGA